MLLMDRVVRFMNIYIYFGYIYEEMMLPAVAFAAVVLRILTECRGCILQASHGQDVKHTRTQEHTRITCLPLLGTQYPVSQRFAQGGRTGSDFTAAGEPDWFKSKPSKQESNQGYCVSLLHTRSAKLSFVLLLTYWIILARCSRNGQRHRRNYWSCALGGIASLAQHKVADRAVLKNLQSLVKRL